MRGSGDAQPAAALPGDDAAVQGGMDWAHSSGFYGGTWVSNVDFRSDLEDTAGASGEFDTNYELDIYAG